jgi:hypothetical protein
MEKIGLSLNKLFYHTARKDSRRRARGEKEQGEGWGVESKKEKAA